MNDTILKQYRSFLKDTIRKHIDFSQTDQHRGVGPPPIEKPPAPEAPKIDLVSPRHWQGIGKIDLSEAISGRKSRRSYKNRPLSRDELSYLLWATQGIRRKIDRGHAYRTVPSAGCRHALETYLAVLNVQDLAPGIYRYLPLEHQIILEKSETGLAERLVAAVFGQPYPGKAAVTFIWTAVPYRMEWRYALAAHKLIALDAGHVCQNLYLACEAIGAGTCAIAAYDQEAMDRLLGVDGDDEFTVYLAGVGKVKD
ncbi:MAG TPA: SagB/ThcOx family dehydrogenase [Syntrophales bacterium]|jgi:SagB-type dehydrogenase family enzyme|nr:SagB/ThcOx family dehydrogenase [Syntrophales bacterium]HRR47490.1 SagB/ThcOx family dehydrogenase [Syntrophales bacterium]